MFAEVERILNDRPLTPLSDDATDLQPLTPSHILLLTSNSSLPPVLLNKEDGYGRRRWRQAQYLAGVFWRRWLKEYLPTLQIRQKWTKISRNFSAGDLVLVATDSANRGQWPLGRITEVFPDVHGHVRSARVRTAAGSLLRPVTCLCLLEDRLVSDQIGKDVETANVIKSDQQEPQEIKSGSLPEQVVSKSTPRPVRDTRGRKPNYLRDFVSQ